MNLDPASYEHACQLAEQALQLPPEERATFVHSAVRESEFADFVVEHIRLLERSLQQPLVGDTSRAVDETQSFTGADVEAPERQSALPRQIGGFTIVEVLGQGGMGVVYRGRDERLQRDVAIKTIRFDRKANEALRVRFHREASSAARLSHPNIVSIYEIGEADGLDYFVMEYVAGRDLQSLGKQSPATAACWTVVIASAAAHAHAQQIVHRDIKPANILIDAEGQPQIADFGLALQLDAQQSLTHDGSVLGTPSYMPPEQAAGSRDLGPAADIYAMGAVLYYMLTGEPPFAGDTAWHILEQIRTESPTPPREHSSQIPIPLETICLKCLEKEPQRRYASAAALADDLQRFLDGRPILARPASVWEKAWLWARRHPAAATVVALLVAICITVPIFSGSFLEVADRAQRAETRQRQITQELAATTRESERRGALAKQAEGSAERARHVSLIKDAAAALKDGKAKVARGLLERCSTERRHWEWRYLHRQCGCSISLSPLPRFNSVDFSDDGTWVIAGGQGGHISIWDSQTRRSLFQLQFPEQANIHELAVSRSHLLAVAAGPDVQVWDLLTEERLAPLPEHNAPVNSLCFDPSGSSIATATATSVQLWDVKSGELRWKSTELQHVSNLTFSRAHQRLALRGDRNGEPVVALLDVVSGEILASIPAAANVIGVALYDRPTAASGEGLAILDTHSLRFLEVAVGKPGATLSLTIVPSPEGASGSTPIEGALSLSCSRDGQRLAVGAKSGIEVYDGPTQTRISQLPGPAAETVAINNGQSLASVDGLREAFLWQPMSRPVAVDLGGCLLGDFSADLSRWLGAIPVWGQSHLLAAAESYRLRYERVGSLVPRAAADGIPQPAPSFSLGADGRAPVGMLGIALSGDGSLVAMGSQRVEVWNTSGEQVARFEPGPAVAWNLAFDSTATRLAAASQRGIKIWSLEDHSLLTEINEPAMLGLAFSQQGHLIASKHVQAIGRMKPAEAGTQTVSPIVFVYDVETGEERFALSGESSSQIPTSVACSSSGSHCAAAMGNGAVLVWDLESGERELALRAHERVAWGVAFHPTEPRLASVGDDGVKIWSSIDGELLLHLSMASSPLLGPEPSGRVIPPRAMASANGMHWEVQPTDTITWTGTGKSPIQFSADGEQLGVWAYSLRQFWAASESDAAQQGSDAANPFGPSE